MDYNMAGIEPAIDSCLICSENLTKKTIHTFPYAPKFVFVGVGDVVNHKTEF